MSVLLEMLSAGKAVDFFARIRGWSPQGRSIVLTSAEGPGASSLENSVLEILEVRGGDLMVRTQQGSVYLLRPRHRGWTARSLMATSIAVSVHELLAGGLEGAIAVAVARLSKAD